LGVICLCIAFMCVQIMTVRFETSTCSLKLSQQQQNHQTKMGEVKSQASSSTNVNNTSQQQQARPPAFTSFFRAMNFELFARQTPITRGITFIGTGLFISLIGYFIYEEQKYKKQREQQEDDD
jgi:hypothetical protein